MTTTFPVPRRCGTDVHPQRFHRIAYDSSGTGMHLQHPKNIKSVRVLRPAPQRRQAFLTVAVLLYAIVGYWVYQTVGIPYETALAEAEELDKKKQLESHEDAIEKGGVTVASFSDFDDDDSGGSYASVSVQSGDSDDNEEVDVLKQALKERDSRGKVKKKKKRKKKEGSD